MKYKICPKCQSEHRESITRCGCGYLWRTQQSEERQYDPMHGCCEWEADGERCRYPGTWSDGTNGQGKWFCSAHSKCSDGVHGARIVAESMKIRNPDYSIEARRNRPEPDYSKKYPGWSVEDHRTHIRNGILGMGDHSIDNARNWPYKVREIIRSGGKVPHITEKWAREYFAKRGE